MSLVAPLLRAEATARMTVIPWKLPPRSHLVVGQKWVAAGPSLPGPGTPQRTFARRPLTVFRNEALPYGITITRRTIL